MPISIAPEIFREAERLGLTVTRGRAEGLFQGRRVSVEIKYYGQNGEWLFVHGHLDPPLDLGLSTANRKLGRLIEVEGVTGNPEIDAEIDVDGDDHARVRALFRGPLEEVVLRLYRSALELQIHDDGVLITQHTGFEVADATWLSRALQGVAEVMSALEEARRSLPVAAELVQHQAAAAAIARAHGLAQSTSPLLISGPIDGRPFHLGARRVGARKYRLFARSGLETPLGVGLAVRRQTLLDDVRTLLGGQDIIVGDEAFDRRFLIRGERADRVPVLLDRRTRGHLLSLDERFGAVAVDDHGITVDPIPLDFQLDEMVILVELVTEAAGYLAENLIHGGSEAGPYR